MTKFKVKGHQQWYATHRLEVVYPHAKYEKPILNDKKVTAQTRFVTDAGNNLTLRSKVTNNGTRHIFWRWSTYMPNMQSLSWTTKKLQPRHDLLRTHGWTEWSLMNLTIGTSQNEFVYKNQPIIGPVLYEPANNCTCQ